MAIQFTPKMLTTLCYFLPLPAPELEHNGARIRIEEPRIAILAVLNVLQLEWEPDDRKSVEDTAYPFEERRKGCPQQLVEQLLLPWWFGNRPERRSRINFSKFIAQLYEWKLINQFPDADERRCNRLVLTEKGQRLINEINIQRSARLATIQLRKISAEQKNVLRMAAEQISKAAWEKMKADAQPERFRNASGAKPPARG